MIKSLGNGLDSLDFLRIALGNQHLFIVIQNSNLSKPLVLTWPQLLQQIQNQINIVGGVSSVNGQTGVVVLSLDDLSDVNAPSPSVNQILQWNGTAWVPATISTGAYTADNGLTENPSNNFQLGSTTSGGAPLLHDTYIDTVINHTLYLEGQKTNSNDAILSIDNTASGGTALRVTGSGSSAAVNAQSTDNYGVFGTSNTFFGIVGQTLATARAGVLAEVISNSFGSVLPALRIRHLTSGTPLVGFGAAIDFRAATVSNSELPLGRLMYQWTDPITISRTSKFQIETVNSATASVKLEVLGSGQLILNQYTTSTSFAGVSGTSQGVLNVDNTGKVFVGAGGGGGGLKSGTATQVSAGVYTTTIAGVTSYTAGDTYIIKFDSVNDGDSTLNISGVGAIPMRRNTDVKLNTGAIKANQEITVVYDGTNFQLIGLVSDQILAYVHNAEGAIISKGQAVYAYQATGGKMSVKLARADSDATSAKTIGLVYDSSIGIGGEGYIITQGVLEGVNTSMFSAGDTLYLSGVTFGAYVNTPVYAPTHFVYVGIVERANANGQIYVRCQNGYEMEEIHDVAITAPYPVPVNNDVLTYITGTPNLWQARSVSSLLPTSVKTGSCGVTFDGQGGVISNGRTAYVQIPYNGTLTGWTLVAAQSGSCTITVFKDTYANYPPVTPADNIYSVQPALASAIRNQNLTPTYIGSQATVTAGDWIGFTISGVTTVTWVNLTISITKT